MQMKFKRKSVSVFVVMMMMVALLVLSGCSGKAKDEEADSSANAESQTETEIEEPKESIPETEKTEWGSDEYGYITLSSDWHKFITSDLTAEKNANMLQWQSGDMRNIVTISSGNNSPEDILAGIASTEEPDTYAIDVYGEEGDDYKLGYFGKWYEDEDLWLVIYTLATDYSDKTYYFSFEGTGYENEDEFFEAADSIFFTHSEFKKTSLYTGISDLDSEFSDSDSQGTSGKVDTSNYKAGDKYPIYDFITDDHIIDVTIPEGFTLDGEYCDKDLLVIEKEESYNSIWVEGYTDYEVNDYLKAGKLDEAIYGKYSNLSVNMIEEYTLGNGFKVYVLEIKYRDDEYDLDIHKYNVSVQKSEEVGVSVSLFDDELKELGFKSIKELLDALFVE